MESDKLIELAVFGPDADMDLYSAAQVTDLVAVYMIADADIEANIWLDDDEDVR